ncbi:MAG TPA: hypothetical protein VF244_01625 [Acidimicrobiales bacterium]
MTTPKKFKAKRVPKPSTLPFEIDIEGPDGTETKKFEAHDFADDPGAGMFLTTFAIDETDSGATRLKDFFKAAMPQADYRRFRGLLDNPQIRVDMDELVAIHNWLVEEYYGRPTSRSTTSSGGRPTTGTSSTESDSSEG